MKKLNECIIVGGEKDGKFFLAKNRDRKYITDAKVYHKMYKDVEVAYYEDTVGHFEGMNEYGVGFVYTYLMYKDAHYYKWRSKWGVEESPTPKSKENTRNEHGDKKKHELKDILLCKSAEEAVEHVKKLDWNGSYLIGDTKGIYEIEHFERETEVRKCDFKDVNFKVKTNYGDIIKDAGHQDGYENVARGNAEVRSAETKRYLIGFKNYTDVLKRMQQQTFTNTSSLNVFRTDDEERTVCQVLMDLNNKTFHFIHHDKNSEFFGLVTDLPKDHKPRLHVYVRNKKEFNRGGEWKEFLQKKDDLYYHYKNFDIDF